MPKIPVTSLMNYSGDGRELIYKECISCGVLQTFSSPEPHVLYGANYNFYSGQSQSYKKYCEIVSARLAIKVQNCVCKNILEVGSNDGTFLKSFMALNCEVQGVEPFSKAAAFANQVGVNTKNTFFSTALVHKNKWEDSYSLVCASNVISHVSDINDFLNGLVVACEVGGYIFIEMVDYEAVLKNTRFDYLYHGVTNLITPKQVEAFMFSHAELIDIRLDSYDQYAVSMLFQKKRNLCKVQFDGVKVEAKLNMNFDNALVNWVSNIEDLEVKIGNKLAIGYGANSKAGMVLALSSNLASKLCFIVDKNIEKHGRILQSIPVLVQGPDNVSFDKYDFIVLFADHLINEVSDDLNLRGFKGEILTVNFSESKA